MSSGTMRRIDLELSKVVTIERKFRFVQSRTTLKLQLLPIRRLTMNPVIEGIMATGPDVEEVAEIATVGSSDWQLDSSRVLNSLFLDM